ncbi:MAG: molybdopterin-synthase adenylyltransferase MoeB [Marinicellaceae bacterium]
MKVTANQAHTLSQKKNHIILDVRSAPEWTKGIPKNAQCLNLDDLNSKATHELSKKNHYYVICQTSLRSKLAINELKKMGFNQLTLISGGFESWLQSNLPIELEDVCDDELRYARHHQLLGFGKKAQQKLSEAHVLIIGVGGLGSPAALYLAAAGVGKITVVDADTVELSNLQRQIIHQTESIGQHKVNSAKKQMLRINPNITVNAIPQNINTENINQIINSVDVVIDGSDNLSTRYLVNDECLKLSKPLIYASVFQYELHASVFDFRKKQVPCLRCLFPMLQDHEPTNCTETGVLGVVPGLAGVIQASEAIKIISEIGSVLAGQLLIIDMLDNSHRKIKFSKSTSCLFH